MACGVKVFFSVLYLVYRVSRKNTDKYRQKKKKRKDNKYTYTKMGKFRYYQCIGVNHLWNTGCY